MNNPKDSADNPKQSQYGQQNDDPKSSQQGQGSNQHPGQSQQPGQPGQAGRQQQAENRPQDPSDREHGHKSDKPNIDKDEDDENKRNPGQKPTQR